MPLLPTEVIQADPTKPLDPNFPADKLPEVKILFQQRLEGILKNSNSDVVKDFFTQYVAEHNVTLSMPITTPEEKMELWLTYAYRIWKAIRWKSSTYAKKYYWIT